MLSVECYSASSRKRMGGWVGITLNVDRVLSRHRGSDLSVLSVLLVLLVLSVLLVLLVLSVLPVLSVLSVLSVTLVYCRDPYV